MNPSTSKGSAGKSNFVLKALEVMNIRELRSLLLKKNPKDWYRLIKETKKVRVAKSKYSYNSLRELLAKSNQSRIEK